MNILVIGSGLIGPAAAYYAMSNPAVTRVTLCDRLPEQLDAAKARLAAMPGAEKLVTAELDLNNQAAAIALIGQHQAVLAALPNTVIGLAIRAAASAHVPLVDLTLPPEAERLGLLSHTPIEIAGAMVAPKTFLDTLLYPQVRLEEGEPDITVLRVDAIGEKDRQPQQLTIDMVER